MNYKLLNKRQRKPKEQSRMDNPETLAKLDTRQGTKTNKPVTQYRKLIYNEQHRYHQN
jgi:hypothetical protein